MLALKCRRPSRTRILASYYSFVRVAYIVTRCRRPQNVATRQLYNFSHYGFLVNQDVSQGFEHLILHLGLFPVIPTSSRGICHRVKYKTITSISWLTWFCCKNGFLRLVLSRLRGTRKLICSNRKEETIDVISRRSFKVVEYKGWFIIHMLVTDSVIKDFTTFLWCFQILSRRALL